MNIIPTIQGFVAAPFTPFRPTGEVAFDTIDAYAKFLKKNQVAGVFIDGTTGEGLSLSMAERKISASTWAAHNSPDFKVMVHVGAQSIKDSCELAAHAASLDLYGIGALTPGFYKPKGVAELVDICAEIASTCPQKPFYYYHIPVMTGVRLPLPEVLVAAGEKIPNFVGLKFTDENLLELQWCKQVGAGKYDILFGRDEMFLGAMALGIRGGIGSTYNYMTPVYQQMVSHYQKGEMEAARKCQLKASNVIRLLEQYGGLATGKYILELTSKIPFGPCRLPNRELDEGTKAKVQQGLAHYGFWDFLLTSLGLISLSHTLPLPQEN